MTVLNGTRPADTANVKAGGGWRKIFSALENKSYRWFWLSNLFSASGMTIQMFARGWLAFDLTGSVFDLGLISAASGVPLMILSPIAGALIDRMERRNLLITTQFLDGLVNLTIAILIALGLIQFWHLLVSSFFIGVINAFHMPGRQSLVPALVGREHVMNAVALNQSAMSISRIAAPALGGVLIALIGVSWVYSMTVFGFLIAGLLLFMIPKFGRQEQDARASIKSEVLEGVNYVRSSSILLPLMLLAFVPLVLGMPYQQLMPAFAVDVFGKGATELGFLMAALGVGTLAGSLIVASLGDFRRKGMLLLGASIAFGMFLIIFSLASYHLSLFVLVLLGIANNCYFGANSTLLLTNTDERMLGRVMGIYVVTLGLLPAGALPMGAVAEHFGVQTAVRIGGILVVAFTLALAVWRPQLKRL